MAANTNTVTLSTNFNVDPYYDDYDEDKNYHRVLYRPGLAVQGRELIQMQTILQNQIDRFGESIYREGSVIKGIDHRFESISYIKVRDNSANGSQVLVSNFEDLQVRGASSNVLAAVLDSEDGSEAADPDLKTLFIKYIDTGGVSTSGNTIFTLGETLNTTTGGYSANVASVAGTAGQGTRIVTSEGIIFAKDHFIKVPSQALVVGKYSRIASYKIGYNITESIVDYTEDSTLLDPSSGSYNYTAPGANRLKLSATLAKYPINADTTSNFVEILRIEGGQITRAAPKPDYSTINEYLARRHYDTSGSFVVNGLSVRLREHLNQANNLGRYSAANGGTATKLIVEMEPGKAFVKGNEIETVATLPVSINKATDYASLEQVNVTPNYGNYLTVDETAGVWDVNSHNVVSLRDAASNAVSNNTFSGTSALVGSEIGTARVRAVEHVSGVKGAPSAQYKLYVYDVNMTNGPFTSVRSLHLDNTAVSQANAVADIVLSSGIASINETNFNRGVFNIPVSSVKTIRDTTGNIDTNFKFLKKFNVTISTGGAFSVATGSADETFPFSTGLLSDTNATTNFHVVINGTAASNATVDTGSMSSGANTVTGLTNADTKFNVGDLIVIGGETLTVSAVASTTLSTLQNSVGPHTTANITKKFVPGQVIDMAGVGGDGSDRSITIASATSASFDIQETLSSTVSATVIVELSKVDGQEIAKNYNSDRYVQIRITDNAANTVGPWNLGLSDVHKIVSVRRKTGNTLFSTASEGEDVTSNFVLNNGQTDNLYKHGQLKLASNKTVTDGDVYLVKLNYFTHDTSQGIGYFSVDSYPIDDNNAANTAAITTQEIPIFTSPVTGKSYDLRNSIDIRPRITDVANDATSVGTASVNPSTSTAIDTVGNGLRYMAPNENMTADLDYYLPRRDVVSLSPLGGIKVSAGVSEINPSYPDTPDDHLVLAKLDIAPYPSLTTHVAQQYSRFDLACKLEPARTERYTMKDIGILRDRVDRVEYFTRLSMLENEASNLKFASDTGIDRFKNGIIVDSFSGHNIGNVLDPDYSISIDKLAGELRPPFTLDNIDLNFNASNSSNIIVGPRDAVITVSGSDTFTVGETVTAGAASGSVVYQVGRKVYLENTSGTFAVSSTASGGTSSSSGTISAVSTPGAGKFASIKYSHRKVIEQKFATTSRNAAGLFWNFLGKVNLSPNNDFWCDTIQAPDLVINFDNTNDNIAAGNKSWSTDWGNWETVWSGKPESEIVEVNPYILTNTPIGGAAGPQGRTITVAEITTEVTSVTETQRRMGIRTGYAPKTVTQNLGSKVVDSSTIPFMRSRVIKVEGRGFKPNARLYAFFDGIDVNSYMTPTNSSYSNTGAEGAAIVTDSSGDVYCKFRLPNDGSIKFRTGDKRFRLSDSPTNETGSGLVTTSGEATYSAKGTIQTLQNTIVSTRTYEVVQETVYDTRTITSSSSNEIQGKTHTLRLTPSNVDGEQRVIVTDLTGEPDAAVTNEFTQTGPALPVGDDIDRYWEWADNGFGDWSYCGGDDPIAQTFTIGNFNNIALTTGAYLTKFDLFFASKDDTRPVFIEIREVDPSTSFVTPKVVPFSRITLEASDINTSSDGSAATPVHFPTPIFLLTNKEYAICIKPAASNPNVSLFVSRLGGTDLLTGERVNKQPYVGTLFASSNDKTWSPIQEEDLKFTTYIANFAKNTTATAVFKNEDRDFMQIAGSNTFNTAGEVVHGATTIVTTPALSANVGLVLAGNTSGANGLIVSVSSNTIVLNDVSLASKFQAGEKLNVVINGVKQGSGVGSNTTQIYVHSVTTPTGNVVHFDSVNYANTVLHLSSVTGTFANNMQIKGQTNGQTASIIKLENLDIDTARLNTGFLRFEESSITAAGKFNINPTTRDTQFRSVGINHNTYYRTPRYLLSKSLESGIGGAKSGEIKFTLSTSNQSIGPVIDIDRVNLTLINNTVNNDKTGETNASGGNALARYISRTMTLAEGQDAEDIRVRLSAYKPTGTDISVYYKILNKDDSDNFSDRDWVLMDQTTVSTVFSSDQNEKDFKLFDFEVPAANLSGGSNEIQYVNSQGVTYTGYKYIAIKIVLTSETSGIVPKVTEMIAIALQA